MSIVHSIEAKIQNRIDLYKDRFIGMATERANKRTTPPKNELELDLAITSELNSIKHELAMEELNEAWTKMFAETIDQANSSLDKEFVTAFVSAIRVTHGTIQGEFWMRMIKVMETISNSGNEFFDGRNYWTKDLLARMIFSYTHSAEVDVLRKMTEDQLYNFRKNNALNR